MTGQSISRAAEVTRRDGHRADLFAVGDLRFTAEAVRARRDNLLLLRSSYEQPFGTFSGTLPGGPELAEGLGVMERHAAWW